jgi:hypothetical protein
MMGKDDDLNLVAFGQIYGIERLEPSCSNPRTDRSAHRLTSLRVSIASAGG